jgi:ABC-type bacteriocin/lantibiotic exporter with double-glycine peptidase domain
MALMIGCIYSWELTLATASGLVLIVSWYAVMTPLIVRRHAVVQEMEKEASGVVSESLLGVRMVKACGAEEKMAARYDKLIEEASAMSKKTSPLLAIQHAPGLFQRLEFICITLTIHQSFSSSLRESIDSKPLTTSLTVQGRLPCASGTPSSFT